jgi:hypothetical protein
MTKEQIGVLIDCITGIAEETFMRMDGRDTLYNSADTDKETLFKVFGFTKEDYHNYCDEK